MADVKKVLVVDDHFEMLEMLRSMLELSNEECEVLAVPSAEEGLMELRRTHFDLVITDVRLPGMSGFDLVRRIQKLGRDVPVIMITAYTTPEGQKEATNLGILRYFPKPLDTDAVLMAVQTALHGDLAETDELPVAYMVDAETAVSDTVRKRLQALRADTGATGLILASTGGQILFEASTSRRLNLVELVPTLSQTIRQSFTLGQHLDSELPSTIQYHAGDTTELYCANIGRAYFLAIFFDVQARRGRIGTIWVFTQRAIKELLEQLPQPTAALSAQPIAAPKPAPAAAKAAPPPLQSRQTVAPPPKAPPPPEPEPEEELVQDERIAAMIAAMMSGQGDKEAEADALFAEDWSGGAGATELENLLGDDFFGAAAGESAGLDDFWESALSQTTPPPPPIAQPTPPPAAPEMGEKVEQDEKVAAMLADLLKAQEEREEEGETAVAEDWSDFDTTELENLLGDDFFGDSSDINTDLDAFWENAISQEDDDS
jgi:CheY-like chemotaxis protein